MKATFLLFTALVAATFADPAQGGETQLSPASIHGLFPGYYRAEVFGGYTLLIAARANGRLDGKAFGRSDKGRWRIVGDRLCVLWTNWTDGEARCGRISRADGWYVAYNQTEGQLLRFKAIGADSFQQDSLEASAISRN